MSRVMVGGGSRDRFTASGHQLVEGATTNAEGFRNRAAYLVVFDRAFARKRIDYLVLVGRRHLLLFCTLGGERLLRLFCKRCEPIVRLHLPQRPVEACLLVGLCSSSAKIWIRAGAAAAGGACAHDEDLRASASSARRSLSMIEQWRSMSSRQLVPWRAQYSRQLLVEVIVADNICLSNSKRFAVL